jgi:hypothetical protein
MSTAVQWDYWISDAVAAAALAEWSPASLSQLMGQIGNSVAATQGHITVGVSQAGWRSTARGLGQGEHLCEFRAGESGPCESGPVEVLLEVQGPGMESEGLVELVGNLVCAAVAIGVAVSVIKMRAELLRLLVLRESHKQQAAGLLAERFQCSVAKGSRRLEDTAKRFQISTAGFAFRLLDARHERVVGPG